jgi:hypothetical protein
MGLKKRLGDLFMSLIYACRLHAANSSDYLLELQSHAQDLAACPTEWMPWNYRETLARIVSLPESAEL